MSEAARNRADLSRRLAETAIEAEQADVENQRLENRVRVSKGHNNVVVLSALLCALCGVMF